ncbi:MAG TPA: hypothetical protein VM493_12865, partial [Vicinamibacterales bacterium]|nr:hypothetical protein [Vicinamibacterales bacterium]
ICNGIYVDNLVHAVVRAIEGRGRDGEAYGVGDLETYRWVDLLSPVAASLGIEPLRIDIGAGSARRYPASRVAILGQLRASVKALLPARIRTALHAGHAAFRAYPSPPPPRRARPQPLVTEETALLHGCTWKLPHDRAVRDLGYAPPVSFCTACAHSIAWLEFAGYPTVRAVRSNDKSD